MEVVINKCYGGFSLSKEAIMRYEELTKKKLEYARSLSRDDVILIRIIKELGEDADGSCAKLKIIEIPDGIKWEIEEYDGKEWVAETHRTWR